MGIQDNGVEAYSIAHIPALLVGVMWNDISERMYETIEQCDGDVTMVSFYRRATTGETMVFAVVKDEYMESVFTAEVFVYESGKRVLMLPLAGGSGSMPALKQVHEFTVDLAKKFECSEVRGMSIRKGWARVNKSLGWKRVHEVTSYKLGE